MEDHRLDYNHRRPHSSLGYLTVDESQVQDVSRVTSALRRNHVTPGVRTARNSWRSDMRILIGYDGSRCAEPPCPSPQPSAEWPRLP